MAELWLLDEVEELLDEFEDVPEQPVTARVITDAIPNANALNKFFFIFKKTSFHYSTFVYLFKFSFSLPVGFLDG